MDICSKTKKRTDVISVVLENETLKVTLRTKYDEQEEIEEQRYDLREISKEELFDLRVSQKPGFVVKKNNAYYYTEIEKELKFVCQNIVGRHCCNTCECFSAKKDGCPKVKDLSITSYNSKYRANPEVINKAKRIEKYDFITFGIESFNTVLDSFVVGECSNYEIVSKKPKVEYNKEVKLKLGLAQYVWPNASTLEEADRYSQKYHMKKSHHNTLEKV